MISALIFWAISWIGMGWSKVMDCVLTALDAKKMKKSDQRTANRTFLV
jgi:hypothetical protein